MPPAAQGMATTLFWNCTLPVPENRKGVGNPVDVAPTQVAVIVKSYSRDPSVAKCPRGLDHLATAHEIGKTRPDYAAKRPRAIHPPLRVVDVGAHSRGAGLVKACLDDASGCRERVEIAAFVPGAAGRTSDGRDDGDAGVCAHVGANLLDERRDNRRTPVEKARPRSVGRDVTQPERLGHVVGEVDVAG